MQQPYVGQKEQHVTEPPPDPGDPVAPATPPPFDYHPELNGVVEVTVHNHLTVDQQRELARQYRRDEADNGLKQARASASIIAVVSPLEKSVAPIQKVVNSALGPEEVMVTHVQAQVVEAIKGSPPSPFSFHYVATDTGPRFEANTVVLIRPFGDGFELVAAYTISADTVKLGPDYLSLADFKQRLQQ